MTDVIRLGYMGIPFSNSEEASKLFTERFGSKEVELIPLMSSKNVIDDLVAGKIDYGVLAVENKFAGPVKESATATKDVEGLNELESLWIPIHHCVFKKNKDDKVTCLISHIQALRQSEKNLKALYPDAVYEECEDTAYAAEMLSKGELPEGYAAVCREDAGTFYNLYLENRNIEDNKDNMTRFSMFSME